MKSLYKEKYAQVQNAVLQQKVDEMLEKAQRVINVNINTIVLGVLHDEFGWGKERLTRFAEMTGKYQKAMQDRYGKDCDVMAMERRLREDCGIDVVALVDNAKGETEIRMGA